MNFVESSVCAFGWPSLPVCRLLNYAVTKGFQVECQPIERKTANEAGLHSCVQDLGAKQHHTWRVSCDSQMSKDGHAKRDSSEDAFSLCQF